MKYIILDGGGGGGSGSSGGRRGVKCGGGRGGRQAVVGRGARIRGGEELNASLPERLPAHRASLSATRRYSPQEITLSSCNQHITPRWWLPSTLASERPEEQRE
ncbi:hypothetical protein V1478_015942 [Vespula squamosa]|uniref:Uncharacterized protein n=1 Tax=Vespula squamosa TaxID=30214 RepID=A0ABD2A304_VESSQ